MSAPTQNRPGSASPGTPYDQREAFVSGIGRQPGQFNIPSLAPPSNTHGSTGSLLKGAVDSEGKLKDAGLMVGIKLDLEAEVHLNARVRGDIIIGLY